MVHTLGCLLKKLTIFCLEHFSQIAAKIRHFPETINNFFVKKLSRLQKSPKDPACDAT